MSSIGALLNSILSRFNLFQKSTNFYYVFENIQM